MPDEDRMPTSELLAYLTRMQKRYRVADRGGRGALLNEMEEMTQLHRETLIRWMGRTVERKPRRRERGRRYGSDVEDVVRVISETLDHISRERLTPALVPTAKLLEAHGELLLRPGLLEALGNISCATVGRMLKRIRQDEPRLPRRGPQEANRLRTGVPMRRIPWDEPNPGHVEVDLVYHSGSIVGGEHVHTLQLVDVTTGWSERAALLGRSYLVMSDGFRRILDRLPFAILELHPDNGSEFFNRYLLRFWAETVPGLTLSRSRPWHKNDNRFVEQKNDTLVRAFLGHTRLDTAHQTRMLNALYERMSLYYNLFQPVMRLRSKEIATDPLGGSRVRRLYDTAATPLERLCRTDAITPSECERLARQRDSINPRELHREIEERLRHLFTLPSARPGITEDVYQTLLTSVPTPQEEGVR